MENDKEKWTLSELLEQSNVEIISIESEQIYGPVAINEIVIDHSEYKVSSFPDEKCLNCDGIFKADDINIHLPICHGFITETAQFKSNPQPKILNASQIQMSSSAQAELFRQKESKIEGKEK